MKHSKIQAFGFKQKRFYSLLILCLIGLYSCDTQQEELNGQLDGQVAVDNRQNPEIIPDEEIKDLDVIEKEAVKQPNVRREIPAEIQNMAELAETPIANKKNYRISGATIDSLNRIYEVYDKELFPDVVVSYFDDLSAQLNGKNFYVEKAEDVMSNIMEIFSTRLNNGTDIVLLIDKTGSMEDDLEQVRKGLTQIESFLSNFDNVNIAVASYGDRNWHGELWFNASEMSSDISKINRFMEGYTMMSNPDSPESVNDAIVKVVDETNWTPGHKRMILVIGDAPSHTGEYSNYSASQVIAHCKEKDVTFNLYPIIISDISEYTAVGAVKVIDPKVFPNPVRDRATIDFGDTGSYDISVFDLNGREVLSHQTSAVDKVELSMGDLKAGQYIIHIYSTDLSKNGIMRVMVQH